MALLKLKPCKKKDCKRYSTRTVKERSIGISEHDIFSWCVRCRHFIGPDLYEPKTLKGE